MSAFRPCPTCRRILHPQPSGNLPPHRVPPAPGKYSTKAVPLTGKDAPWCRSGR